MVRRSGNPLPGLFLLCVAVLFPGPPAEASLPGRLVFSPYSATTVRPQPAYEFFNPAFAYLPEEHTFDFGSRLPLGVVALLLFPERNPLSYFTRREVFDRRFDLLSFYDQLRYPSSVLINPGESPREVVVGIGRNAIRVTTGEGSPLLFEDVSGASGVSRPFSPLVPAPLVSYHHQWNDFYSVTGLFLASTGHSLTPDNNLQDVLDGDPVEPETRYEVTAAASAAAGLSQSFSYGITAYGWGSSVTVAPRLVGYYRFFTAEARIRAGAETDQDNLPAGTDSQQSLFVSYPGNGWGAGTRMDLGTAIVRDRFRLGVSVLNIFGVDTVTGTITDENVEEEPKTITTVGSAPASAVSASYRVALETGELELAVDTLVSESIATGGGLFFFRGMLMLGLSAGYKGGFEGTATVGLRADRGRRAGRRLRPDRRRVALSLNVHRSPFVQDVVWGVGLHGRVRR